MNVRGKRERLPHAADAQR